MCDEVWIGVDVYGPQEEIDRFKARCIVSQSSADGEEFSELDFSGIVPRPEGSPNLSWVWDHPWNFRDYAQTQPGSYYFGFDMSAIFPNDLFECLAELFPRLLFHCESIGSSDEFMGFGWFNGPPEGEVYAEYEVPKNYWTTCFSKRSKLAHEQHLALVAAIAEAAREASR